MPVFINLFCLKDYSPIVFSVVKLHLCSWWFLIIWVSLEQSIDNGLGIDSIYTENTRFR
jgi:hypothetical protein